MSAGPLAGIRVLDFTWIIAGPFTTRILIELGADVIKVERPGIGDFYRQGDHRGARPDWAYWNYGKRSVGIDLKHPRGVALCRELALRCDVLVENFRPGTLNRLGLGPEVLLREHPRLVYCSISGFGETSPERDRPLHAGVAHALSGIMTLIGRPDDPPFQPTPRLADTVAGIHAALAVCAALVQRERTGRGARIDLAVLDSLVWTLGPYAEFAALGKEVGWEARDGLINRDTVPSGVYQGADGWIVIGGGVDDANWQRLAPALGRADLAGLRHPERHKRQDEIYGIISDWVRAQSSVAEAEQILLAHDVICGKVNTPAEMVTMESLRARGTIERVEHRDLGPIDITNAPFHLDGVVPHWPGPGPRLGEHNREVMGELLGLDAGAIATLEADGVLSRSPDEPALSPPTPAS
ncbi:MAG: CoA transferase [Dehalococcoidia bacterium]